MDNQGKRILVVEDSVAGKIEELNKALDRIMALQVNPPISVRRCADRR